MAAYADRVKDSTTTTGTGDLTLSGTAPTGYQTFNAAPQIGVGPRFGYSISSVGGSEWETGFGYLSASTTLVRDRVMASSNAGAAVNLSAGTKDVFLTQIAASIADLGITMAYVAGSLIQ